jgi:hypothetical protein
MPIVTFHQQGLPYNANGKFLLPGTQLAPQVHMIPDNWSPFESGVQFLIADLLYHYVKMSASNINTLMELWEIFTDGFEVSAPF